MWAQRTAKVIANLISTRIAKFRDLHKGESCYIFGDGPSVKWFDLKKFANLPAICCGVLPFHRDFHELDLRYCLLLEPWAFAPKIIRSRIASLKNCESIVSAYRSVIKRNPKKQFFINLTNCLSISGKNVNFVFRKLPNNKSSPAAASLNQFDVFAGSFHGSLALAWYMGFSKIYLIGFDAWTIQPARNLHWYELGEGVFFEPTNFATDFLEIMKAEMDIFTISVHGQSRNVRNITYESYTGESPTFKENHEIMDERYREIMASYPGYKIFPDTR